MPLMCPGCREALDAKFSCPIGHAFEVSDGVLRLFARQFDEEFGHRIRRIQAVRAASGQQVQDPAVYPGLPFSGEGLEWRLRRYDLRAIRGLLGGRGPRSVLDVGAWNGWLSNRLAQDGHWVTAVDYFADAHDGLAAAKFYAARFRAIQMDLLDLSVLGQGFDVIILNRCLQFAPEPLAYVEGAAGLLAPGGLLIATGIQCFRDARVKRKQVEELQSRHRQEHGFELLLRPAKGYLGQHDLDQLKAAGMVFHPYPELRIANLKARLRPTRPAHYFGVLRRGGQGFTDV